jgi:hypothetical protein
MPYVCVVTLVSTPMVRSPSGSTVRAILSPSLLTKSLLAAVTARIMAFGFWMKSRHMLRI